MRAGFTGVHKSIAACLLHASGVLCLEGIRQFPDAGRGTAYLRPDDDAMGGDERAVRDTTLVNRVHESRATLCCRAPFVRTRREEPGESCVIHRVSDARDMQSHV